MFDKLDINTQAIAEELYNLSLDMDGADYEETAENTIAELEIAIYDLLHRARKGDKKSGLLLSALIHVTCTW